MCKRIDWDDMGISVNGENLNHLRFADDAVLISGRIDKARASLGKLHQASGQVGLKINISKTQFMTNQVVSTNIPLGDKEVQYQVQQIQEESVKLQVSYAGDRAKEITNREQEVPSAWASLQMVCEQRKGKLADTGDLFEFFNLVRTLMQWMDNVVSQVNTSEKPRYFGGVELLMSNQKSPQAKFKVVHIRLA
ncbi:spectrin beta chain-like [Dendroctonus ponderosae]|uniref:spectrin beta chain-like n=1 Tax=Dendroctonus ponderosae TaxID=77166 RepID=UPI00203634D3|nr:spectrin beta chain-like [Dendroctonus ponderosae]